MTLGRFKGCVMGKKLLVTSRELVIVVLICTALSGVSALVKKEDIESSLTIIHEVSTKSLGTLCVTDQFRSLTVPLDTLRFESARQKADLAAMLLQDLGVAHHNGLQDAISKNILVSDSSVLAARVLAINATTGALINCAWWQKQGLEMGGPKKVADTVMEVGHRPSTDYPWYEDADSSPGLRSPKFIESPPNVSYRGWWTYPYYSCSARRWLMSYSVPIPPPGRRGLKGFLSLDVDVSHLEVNQCEARVHEPSTNSMTVFHGSHKCHNATTECVFKSSIHIPTWSRGRYQCQCRPGYYSPHHDGIFNGSLVEDHYDRKFRRTRDLRLIDYAQMKLMEEHFNDPIFKNYGCMKGISRMELQVKGISTEQQNNDHDIQEKVNSDDQKTSYDIPSIDSRLTTKPPNKLLLSCTILNN